MSYDMFKTNFGACNMKKYTEGYVVGMEYPKEFPSLGAGGPTEERYAFW
jgi:hypothetical protein